MKKLFIILFTVATIVYNYLQSSKIAEVSARFQSAGTPADFAFLIWGFVYAGLLWFVLSTNFNVKMWIEEKQKPLLKNVLVFWICTFLNLWCFLFVQERVVLSLVIILLLLGMCYSLELYICTNYRHYVNPKKGSFYWYEEKVLSSWSVFFIAWIFGAVLQNSLIILVKYGIQIDELVKYAIYAIFIVFYWFNRYSIRSEKTFAIAIVFQIVAIFIGV